MAEGLELDDLEGAFQPKRFYDSINLSPPASCNSTTAHTIP